MNQLSKNTVKGTHQLADSDYVVFEFPKNPPSDSNFPEKRVLFAGNSITLHGVLPEIGWHNRYGMAASKKENDYVHVCMREISKYNPNTPMCICQVCDWETNYKNGESKYYLYEKGREFGADIIIMRALENCPSAEFDKDVFKKEYDKLINFLNPNGNAHVVLTTGFWHHPADEAVREYSKEKNLPLAELGDLGEDDKMKAIGLFEHTGVANHPGDLGMKTIAERILKLVLPILK